MPIRGCQCGAVRNEVAVAPGCALHVNSPGREELAHMGSQDAALDLTGARPNWSQSGLPIVVAPAGTRQFVQGAR